MFSLSILVLNELMFMVYGSAKPMLQRGHVMAFAKKIMWGRKSIIKLFKRCYSLEIQQITTENYSQEKKVDHNRVPFLYLPHTAQKAYHVHWSSTSLPKIFDKYKWLTKTLSSPQIPDSYIFKEKEDVFSVLNETLRQATSFQKVPKNRNSIKYFNERIGFSFFSNVLKNIPQLLEGVEHLNAAKSLLYYKPLLETHWPRNYKFYHTEFRPTFVLKTKYSLQQVERIQELSPEEVANIPGPYGTYDLNVYEKSILHLRNRAGMDNSRFNDINNCHTSVMVNNKLLTDEQFYAGGLMTCFSQTLSSSLDHGALFGTDVTTPRVTHSVVTNGKQIAFFVFQLNTLNLMDDKGVWNRLWYSPLYDISTPAAKTSAFYETVDTCEMLVLNEDVAKHLIMLFGHKTKALSA